MSQQLPELVPITPSQSSPHPASAAFSLENVDVQEQELIHRQVARKLDSAYDSMVQEALRRSLLEAPPPETLAMNRANGSLSSPAGQSVDPPSLTTGRDDDDDTEDNGEEDCRPALLARGGSSLTNGAASALCVDSANPEHIVNLRSNSDLDANDEDENNPRSRLGQFNHRERRPSLDRSGRPANLDGDQHDRSPSPDRTTQRDRRRPSLDRGQHQRSASPDRSTQYQRRPSLQGEGACAAPSRRRPSLDRDHRRPSLERNDRQRRPSLDRSEGGRTNGAEGGVSTGGEEGSQGINTLRPWPLTPEGVPGNWDAGRLPEVSGDCLYCLVELSPVEREYQAVTVDFEEAGLKVGSVQRLQNTMLLERFLHEKQHLVKRRPPDFNPNERYLYHGTRANQQRLCEEGLDQRLSFKGCFGSGIYFSDNPRKCMQYADCGRSSSHTGPMILVCRVLLGDSKVYPPGKKDSELSREPEKPNASGGWRYYDSVQGIPIDYPEFVVYDNRRSMIEYIVTFEEMQYRAPPSVYNYYPSLMPALYKCEPIVLPIPEDELDKLYMLLPDTDSDGSCDEHTREVERLRENVKRGKAKRMGIPFRHPTKEEKRYERLHWKRVCYHSCPPNSPMFDLMILKKKEEKAERKKRKQAAREQAATEQTAEGAASVTTASTTRGAVAGSASPSHSQTCLKSPHSAATDAHSTEREEFEVENESVGEVLSNLIADFLNITSTDDVTSARQFIMENNMDLDTALQQYFHEM